MLTLDHITKSFGATRAVDDVSLEVAAGEIVAIVGENGAGKTTLVRITAGELAPDNGSRNVEGRVELVHQHFMLVSNFTIAENLALAARGLRAYSPHVAGLPARRRLVPNQRPGKMPGRMRAGSPQSSGLHTRRSLERDAERIIASTGIDLSGVGRTVAELSVGERSKLELIKAISREPDLLILDEPTSVLTPSESGALFDVVRELASAGTTILFITHKLREVLAVADRVVVMRAGRVVAETAVADATAEKLAQAMVGERTVPAPETVGLEAEPAATAETRRAETSPALLCEQVSGERLDDVSLQVGPGEIVAIVGVAGNGQAQLAAILRGIIPAAGGRIVAGGAEMRQRDLRRTRHIGHVPEDRTRHGIVAEMSLAENIALTARRWNPQEARRFAERIIELYSIRAQGASRPAGSLSGGNQQKLVLARELDRRPACIVAAEPTRGLDIASTEFVHQRLRLAAAAGSGILLITSDLDEAFALAHAMYVIYRGRTSARLTPAEAAAQVANLMAGAA